MNIKRVFSYIAIAVLLLCLICGLINIFTKHNNVRDTCNKVFPLLIFISIVLISISQLLNESHSKFGLPPRCSGGDRSSPTSCVFGVCDTKDSKYVRIFNPNNTDDENYNWCLDPCKEFPDGKGCTNASVKGQSLADTLQKQVKKLGIDTKQQSDGQFPWFKCVGKGSTELNNRGGLVTNLKTDLYGGTTTLDLCGLYGYPGYSGCFSRFNVYQDASEYGCPPHCTDITNKVTNPTCSNKCEPGINREDPTCCTLDNGASKCNSGVCAKWNDDGNTYCCPTKESASAYCINLSPGDSCKSDNQCIYNRCIPDEKGDKYCGDECAPNTKDPKCCTWANGPNSCKSGVCAKWGKGDDNTYCCPTKNGWKSEGNFPWVTDSAYCINLSKGDPCEYHNQCNSGSCKSNDNDDTYECA